MTGLPNNNSKILYGLSVEQHLGGFDMLLQWDRRVVSDVRVRTSLWSVQQSAPLISYINNIKVILPSTYVDNEVQLL